MRGEDSRGSGVQRERIWGEEDFRGGRGIKGGEGYRERGFLGGEGCGEEDFRGYGGKGFQGMGMWRIPEEVGYRGFWTERLQGEEDSRGRDIGSDYF